MYPPRGVFALVDDQRRAFELDVVAHPLEPVEQRTLKIEPVLDEAAIGRAIGPRPLHLLDEIVDHRTDHCGLKISGGDDLVKQVAAVGHDNLRMTWE